MVFSISLSMPAIAQLEVKEGSFKEVAGFVNINIDKMYDDNDKPYSVLKIKTENIDDKQRHELLFQGNAATFFEVEYKTGEVWVYLSYYATYIKISHPDLSSTEFWFPFDMEPKKGYEMTLVNKTSNGKVGFGSLSVTTKPEDGATVKLNGIVMTQKTPYVNDMISVGEYDVEISKHGFKKVTRHIVIQEGAKENVMVDMPYACGSLKVTSEPSGAYVYVDNVKRGKTPVIVNDLHIGNHTVCVEAVDYKTVTKKITIAEDKTEMISVKLEPLTSFITLATSYVQNGYKFMTLDLMMNQYGNLSYGATLGYMRKFGFYISAASSFYFDGYNYDLDCDKDFFVNGYYPDYTGKTHYTSLSIIGGVIMKVAGPVALKVGAGYGNRIKLYETSGGHLVKYPDYSATGVDVSAGLQFNLRGFVFSVDCVTTNCKIYEAKIGLGYGIKNK